MAMNLYTILSDLFGFVSVRKKMFKAHIDNVIARTHYTFTTALLFACGMLISANELIGHPISCMSDPGISERVINSYCWIAHTFTLPDRNTMEIGKHAAHRGVYSSYGDDGEKRYHSYYQWVPFMLFIQGILFYLPHWIWKNWEAGKIDIITKDIRGSFMEPMEKQRTGKNNLIKFLIDYLHKHNVYAATYYACDLLNFLNVIGNIYLTDRFLGGEFLSYGTKVLEYSDFDQENGGGIMATIFPRVTKCTFHKYGSSGNIEKHDALCVLSLNVLNEKIYIVLWFWFVGLTIMSAMSAAYSVAMIASPSFREIILLKRFKFGTPKSVSALVKKLQVGDFLILHLLGQNLTSVQLSDIINGLRTCLEMRDNGVPLPNILSAIDQIEPLPINTPNDEEELENINVNIIN